MPEDREYELKFTVAPAAASRLATHPALAAAKATSRREHLVSTYFDTAEGALHQHRVTLRVRAIGQRTVQTLKRSGASLVDRDEWEREGGDTPDISWLRSTPLADLFSDKAVSAGLDPRFTVDVDRTILPIAFEGTSIEGAFDEGTIRADIASMPVNEFELEHKDGPAEGLVRLARTLARDVPLVLSLTSKAERGFAVADASWGHPSKRIPLELAGIGTLGDLFTRGSARLPARPQWQRRPDRRCRERRGRAQDAHRAPPHSRRAGVVPAGAASARRRSRLERALKWMSDRLGAARDSDVFRHLAETGTDGTRLADTLEPRRRRAHARLKAALASARWRLLLIDILAFSIDGMRRSRRERRAAPFTRRRLRKLSRHLAEDARGLRRLRPEALHDVRKRAKMLRYDLDLVADLPKLGVRGKRLRRTGDDLQTLQDTLGEMHDAVALGERLQESILSRRVPPKSFAVGEWPAVLDAARAMQAREPNAHALQKATKAARRLRRRAM